MKRGLHALCVFALAIAIRFYKIEAFPLWSDEIFSWLVSHLSPSQIVTHLYEGNNPPLWELLLHFWEKGWGDDVRSIRSLSALLSAGAAVGLFLLGARTGKMWVGWLSASLWIFSSFGQSVGREARAYALLAFLTTLSHLAFLRWKATNQGFFLWAASLAGLFFTHYMGLSVAVVQIFYLLLTQPERLSRSLYSLAILSLGFSMQAVILIERLISYPQSEPKALELSLEGLYNLLWRFSNQPVPTVIGAGILLIGLFLAWKARKSQKEDWIYPYFAFLGIYLPLWFLGIFLRVWQDRYLIPAAMGYYWALGTSFFLMPKWIRLGMVGAFLPTWMLSWTPTPSGMMPFYRELSLRVQKKPSHLWLIVSPSWCAWDWAYYFSHPIRDLSSQNLFDRLSAEMRLYYRITGASAYADLPPCEIQAADTIWWLEMNYCSLFPEGMLQDILSEDFYPIRIERFGKNIYLWTWIRGKEKPTYKGESVQTPP
ncbi:MAG: glycosyltransferase family 39 protein [Bacteroidia bacterium]|nr:glycosyltransferase family 39 protein [Bacteroidia bacterium]MDW8015208.1 glycosyltransferase family 39 protein [Bacteroidia bacterium]